ncbi:MAG: leucine-rich repeat domain-containing protein, partial [Metamycoplasmataceae bacterium]
KIIELESENMKFKNQNKNIMIGSLSIIGLTWILGTSLAITNFISNDNSKIENSLESKITQSNTTLNTFQGTILTKDDVKNIGWDTKTIITLEDWTRDAPNVIEISPEATGGWAQDAAFSFNNTIVSIEIPATIKKINYATFFNSGSLETVTFEEESTLESIGNQAFANAPGTLPTANELIISLPESINSIGQAAFSYSMLKSITIPANITSLSNNLFEGSKINTINFGDNSSLTAIGNEVFRNAAQLENILIPNAVTKIGGYTFRGTKALKTITIPTNVTILESSLFESSNIETIIFDDKSTLGTIGGSVFKNAALLTTINVPVTVEKIGNDAFQGTPLLNSITMIYDLYTIESTFYGFTKQQWDSIIWTNIPKTGKVNTNLAHFMLRKTSIITWNDLESYSGIENEAFKNTEITELTIEFKENFTIGDNAFQDTGSLEKITLDINYKNVVKDFGFSEKQLENIKYTTKNSSDNTGIIVGSILGGIAVIAIGIGGFLYWKKLKKASK